MLYTMTSDATSFEALLNLYASKTSTKTEYLWVRLLDRIAGRFFSKISVHTRVFTPLSVSRLRNETHFERSNLAPRVFRLFGQRLVARRDSGVLEFYHRLPNLVPRDFRLFGQWGNAGKTLGHRILLPQDFCGKTMETVTEQPINKIEFFRCPKSLPGVAPLTKKPEVSGYEIAACLQITSYCVSFLVLVGGGFFPHFLLKRYLVYHILADLENKVRHLW